MADPVNNSINSTSKQDFIVTTATAGADRKLSITNTDNSNAASNAHLQLTSGGASGGDPYVNFLVTGAGTFSVGIDNSDSDLFKIVNGATASSGTDRITLTAAGVLSLYGQTIAMGGTFAGLPVGLLAGNLDGTNAASDCVVNLYTQPAGGDAYVLLQTQGVTNFCIGIDNSDADKLKISTGGTPSAASTVFSMTTAGEIIMPFQPAFSAYNSTARTNVTGDGTSYTLIFNTEQYDQNNDFDSTSTFTAPVTGIYHFDLTVYLSNLGALHTSGYITLTHSTGTTYYGNVCNVGSIRQVTNLLQLSYSKDIKMTAGDTITATLVVAGSTKTVGVDNTPVATVLNGRLAC